eukprot:396877_1
MIKGTSVSKKKKALGIVLVTNEIKLKKRTMAFAEEEKEITQYKIVVVGATGSQGSAVIEHLLNSKNKDIINILGLTRNPLSKKCNKLLALSSKSKHNLSFAKCDISLGKKEIIKHFKGANAAFIMTFGIAVENNWNYNGNNELINGKHLIESAAESNISFIVFTSVISAQQMGKNITQCYCKYEMENIIHSNRNKFKNGYVILRLPEFMDNLFKFFPISDGYLNHVYNADTNIQCITCDDIGRIASLHFLNNKLHKQYNNNTIDLIGDELNGKKMANIVTDVSGTKIKYNKGPASFFWGAKLIPSLESLRKMYEWVDINHGWGGNINESKKYHPNLTTFRQFADKHYKNDTSIGYSYRKRIIVITLISGILGAGVWVYNKKYCTKSTIKI